MTPVTISITALNDLISIVHIPIKNEDDRYSTKIYWSIEKGMKATEEFFNITSNRLEIAIFASKHIVHSEWEESIFDRGGDNAKDVKISHDWRVFEIDSGDIGDEVNSGNYDSPHLRHVSAPLSRENITILYQSSYHADFLLVKQVDFELASRIFADQGWTVNSTSSPPPSGYTSPMPSSPYTPYTAVPMTPHSFPGYQPRSPHIVSSDPDATSQQSTFSPQDQDISLKERPSSLRFSSDSHHSITVLSPPLAFIGFHSSNPNFKVQMDIVQKYITWPDRCQAELSIPIYGSFEGNDGRGNRPFISFTKTQDGASLVAEVKTIRGLFKGVEDGILEGGEIGNEWESEAESDMELDSDLESGEDEGFSASASMVIQSLGTDMGLVKQEDGVDDSDGSDDTPKASQRIKMNYQNGYFDSSTLNVNPGITFDQTMSKHRRSVSHPVLSFSHLGKKDFRGLTHSASGNLLRSPRKKKSEVYKEEKGEKRQGRKRCLQLDMTGVEGEDEGGAYHLDKSGLVTRFSSQLSLANIRMLYSSTFHTANILVDAKDIENAKAALQSH